jgi:hypothetical protein
MDFVDGRSKISPMKLCFSTKRTPLDVEMVIRMLDKKSPVSIRLDPGVNGFGGRGRDTRLESIMMMKDQQP